MVLLHEQYQTFTQTYAFCAHSFTTSMTYQMWSVDSTGFSMPKTLWNLILNIAYIITQINWWSSFPCWSDIRFFRILTTSIFQQIVSKVIISVIHLHVRGAQSWLNLFHNRWITRHTSPETLSTLTIGPFLSLTVYSFWSSTLSPMFMWRSLSFIFLSSYSLECVLIVHRYAWRFRLSSSHPLKHILFLQVL